MQIFRSTWISTSIIVANILFLERFTFEKISKQKEEEQKHSHGKFQDTVLFSLDLMFVM